MKDMPAALLVSLSKRNTQLMHRVFERVVDKAGDIDPALAELARRGCIRLRPVEASGPGRPPSPTFDVNPATFADAKPEKRSQNSRNSPGEPENASFSEVVGLLESGLVAEEGLEPNHVTGCGDNQLRQSPTRFGTDSGTREDETAVFVSDLQTVIDAWPSLSEADRDAMLLIVRQAAAASRC